MTTGCGCDVIPFIPAVHCSQYSKFTWKDSKKAFSAKAPLASNPSSEAQSEGMGLGDTVFTKRPCTMLPRFAGSYEQDKNLK